MKRCTFQNIEYTLEYFYRKKEEKELCRKRCREEREEYNEKLESIEKYELSKKKIEQEKKRNQIEEKIERYKKDLDFLLSLYENREIIDHLKKEWNQQSILPSSFSIRTNISEFSRKLS